MKILSLSGLIPEQICDTIRFFGYDGEQRISHYCGYAADYISRVLADDDIDGAVFPKTCDSARIIGSYLEGCGKFVYRLHIPAQNSKDAKAYFAESLRSYKKAIEKHYGIVLERIQDRCALVNARNKALKKLYDNLSEISYSAYINMIHEILTKPLAEQKVPDSLEKCHNESGARVYVVGSTITNTRLFQVIEDAGMNIVGDRIAQSRRLFLAPEVVTSGDIFENIAESVVRNLPSPSMNRFADIIREEKEELLQKQIKGVIYVSQKYCEPYDYLYSDFKKLSDETGIKLLHITVSDSTDEKDISLAVETFADTL